MYTHETDKDLGVTQAKPSTILLQVPVALKRRLVVDAAQRGMTIRALILQALSESGYDIPLEERKDKRKTRPYVKPSVKIAFEAPPASGYITDL